MTLEEFTKNLQQRITENSVISQQVKEHEIKITENIRTLGCVKDTLKIIEGLALEKRNGIKSGIENVVTSALKMLYGEEYSFNMTYSEKNNRSCLDVKVFRVTPDGIVKRDISGIGGGVSDCISIPLRMMVLKGSNAGDILFLDEAFKHIDKDMVDKVGEFLKTISEKLDMQIIMSSHHQGILNAADKGFYLTNDNGEVRV